MKRILVVEDEAAIRDFVVINLQRAGYEVMEAECGEDALRKYDEDTDSFDIAILDITMPGIDGFTVCRELRKRSESIGIIMLTARTQEMDKVNGLMQGADDYVTKPFSPTELLARVDSLYRRVSKSKPIAPTKPSTQIESGRFVLDLRSRSLSKDGRNIELTQIEFQIMEYFFANPDEPIGRTVILHKIWGEEYFGEEKIVDVNIRRLRMKIEEDASEPKFIVTVWGRGYMWDTTAT